MGKKVSGKEPASDELLEKVANQQIRADYRKSLGKEHARLSWDVEIKKAFKKDRE